MKRTRLNRRSSTAPAGPLRRRTSPIPVSATRRARAPERAAAVAEAFARHGHRCVAQRLIPEITCGGRLDAHELIRRSQWREGIYVATNVVPLCRRHHEHIGTHITEARAHGLHLPNNERERIAEHSARLIT